MWLEPLSQLFVTVALLGQTTATAPPALPKPIVTSQPVFAIPFRIEQTDPASQPIEVQLLVSTDRGGRWQLYSKVPPSQQHFLFRADGDGEYWFAIRTIDRSGQARPEKTAAPGLRVLVDTRSTETKGNVAQSPSAVQSDPTRPGGAVPQTGVPQTVQKAVQSDPARPGTAVPQTTVQNRPAQPMAAVPPAGPNVPRDQTVAQPPVKPNPGANPATGADPKGSVAIAISSAIGKNYGAGDAKWGTADEIAGLPPGERPRMVNSRLFQLEYDVDSIGPSGIGQVKLWGTRDGGKSWSVFPASNDTRNTLLVSVGEEGIYGFRVVVTNGAGLGGRPPASGDLPDLWVGVDLSKPTAQIVSARQGVDAETGRLVISWQADDRMLAARPVSLSFSPNRSEPWAPIASGLENTGRYAWAMDSRTPPEFYLRLEVRDEAGNVAVYVEPTPVVIDQSRPKIRVRDVRPVTK